MQGTRVPALVQEDPTCRRAAKPVRHNYWACALEPTSHNYWACALEPTSHNYWACALEPTSHNYWARAPQLWKPTHLEPVLRNKRSHRNKKPAHHNEDPTQPKINTLFLKIQKIYIFFSYEESPNIITFQRHKNSMPGRRTWKWDWDKPTGKLQSSAHKLLLSTKMASWPQKNKIVEIKQVL